MNQVKGNTTPPASPELSSQRKNSDILPLSVDEEGVFDPRSPALNRSPIPRYHNYLPRNPINEQERFNVGMRVLLFCWLTPCFFSKGTATLFDPRSPTQALDRTPLSYAVPATVDLHDPRSPANDRTPLHVPVPVSAFKIPVYAQINVLFFCTCLICSCRGSASVLQWSPAPPAAASNSTDSAPQWSPAPSRTVAHPLSTFTLFSDEFTAEPTASSVPGSPISTVASSMTQVAAEEDDSSSSSSSDDDEDTEEGSKQQEPAALPNVNVGKIAIFYDPEAVHSPPTSPAVVTLSTSSPKARPTKSSSENLRKNTTLKNAVAAIGGGAENAAAISSPFKASSAQTTPKGKRALPSDHKSINGSPLSPRTPFGSRNSNGFSGFATGNDLVFVSNSSPSRKYFA